MRSKRFQSLLGKSLGQGQHGDSQKKLSEYLKTVQTILENISITVKRFEEDNLKLRKDNDELKTKLETREGTSPEVVSKR